jgi:hypothetical protein
MVNLFYVSSKDARTDCEILGIDKRRVKNLIRPHSNKSTYSENTGHWHKIFENGEVIEKQPITTYLNVNEEILNKVDCSQLHYVDDETYQN